MTTGGERVVAAFLRPANTYAKFRNIDTGETLLDPVMVLLVVEDCDGDTPYRYLDGFVASDDGLGSIADVIGYEGIVWETESEPPAAEAVGAPTPPDPRP